MSSSELVFAVLGGLLMSLSTSFHLYFKGRITGMSGIFFGFITNDPKSFSWKCLFLLMTFFTSILTWEIFGFDKLSEDYPSLFDHPSQLIRNLNDGGYFIAGLLVGLGTKLGNGCTSGHGVCGLPRFSKRSWVYVSIFLAVAMITATFRYYVPFLEDDRSSFFDTSDYSTIMDGVLLLVAWGVVLYILYYLSNFTWAAIIEIIVTSFTAILFALGLIISGMNKRSKILGFLILSENWDVSLMLVLCAAVGLNILTFYIIIKKQGKTFFGENLEIPSNTVIDKKLIIGGVLFGLGWGLGGLCPGPGYILFPFLTPQISFFWFFGMTMGQYMVKIYETKFEKKE